MKIVTGLKDWLKEDKRNARFAVHVSCVLATVIITFIVTRSLVISGSQTTPLFIQESADFMGKLLSRSGMIGQRNIFFSLRGHFCAGSRRHQRGNEMTDFTHLPEWAAKAINDFDAKVADGDITFTGEFADEPKDTLGGWIGSDLSQHLPVMDIG